MSKLFPRDFCAKCGASNPPRHGEGMCTECPSYGYSYWIDGRFCEICAPQEKRMQGFRCKEHGK